jgi:hypothetical protein
MSKFINHIAAAVLALGGIQGTWAAEIQIRHAAEIEFQTERGHYYQLQRSTNYADWQSVENSIYGHGGRESRLRSTRPEDSSSQEYYRVVVTDAPTQGFAPWALTGITIELDDEPGGDVTQFITATTGVDVSVGDNDSFTYSYLRTGTNEAKAEILYAASRKDLVTFAFTGPGVGTWSRDEFRDGRLKDHDAGPFRIMGVAPAAPGNTGTSINPNVIVAPPVGSPTPPTTLSNLVYYFQSSGVPDRYEFLDDRNGREIQGIVQEGLPTNSLVYTYTVLGPNTASLQLSFGYYGMGGDRYDCDLTFTDGSSGHFTRRLYRRGVLKDTDEGAFSPNQNLIGPTGGITNFPPTITNSPAVWPPVITPTAAPAPLVSLHGKNCYVFLNPNPDTYQFTGVNYGYALPGAGHGDEEIEVQPNGNIYNYTYKTGASNTATLVITYGYYNLGGDREEYDLEYVDGSTARFNRRLYRQGALYLTQAGLFSTNATLPYAMPMSTNSVPPGDYDFFMDTGEYLRFTSSTSGIQNDDSAPTNFTHTYTKTGTITASLRIQFKSDKWDDYTLTYTDSLHGTFTRQQYDKSALKDSDSGHFTAKHAGP